MFNFFTRAMDSTVVGHHTFSEVLGLGATRYLDRHRTFTYSTEGRQFFTYAEWCMEGSNKPLSFYSTQIWSMPVGF